MNAQRTLAPALGWFSLALGATQLAAPHHLSRAIGTDDNALLMRSLGLRELGAGVAVLSRRKPSSGLWARVAGDAMDLALLGAAMRNERNDRSRVGVALASVAAIAIADIVAAMAPSTQPKASKAKPDFTKSVSIYLTADDLFEVLCDASTFRKLFPAFEEAELTMSESQRPSRIVWNVNGARAFSGRFEIVIHENEPERGTSMRLDAYAAGGLLPSMLRRVIAEFPGDEVSMGLRRLKNIAEVGYIVSNDGPSGRGKVELV